MALAAIFLVFGWILPLVTGRIPEIGNMLCPMHIPVMLCGFILGPWYGLIIGFITPLTRGFIFGMPTFYPTGISMAFTAFSPAFKVNVKVNEPNILVELSAPDL